MIATIKEIMTSGPVDITGAEMVEVTVREDGKVIWINVDGVCVTRVCRITLDVIVNDQRRKNK